VEVDRIRSREGPAGSLIRSPGRPRTLDGVRVVRILALFVVGVAVTVAVVLAGLLVLGLSPLLARLTRRPSVAPRPFGWPEDSRP
jgi:hypothetical protein